MIRRMALGLLALTLALAALPAQDPPDEPPKLKKKDRPNLGSEKPPEEEEKQLVKPSRKLGEGNDDRPKDDAKEPAVDPEELLRKVIKDSRKAEDRIANKELDEPTKQLQRDVVAGLDELIKQNQKPPQANQNQGGGGQQNQNPMGGQQQAKGQRGQRGQQSARNQGQGQGQNQGEGQAQGEGQGQGQNDNGLGGGGGRASEEAAKLAEIYKDIWGHLPESLRSEMNAYSREQFMDKYRDQLKSYYKAISEKGRKGD